jgi:uncharacterized cupredoxin-like copper-binding protein
MRQPKLRRPRELDVLLPVTPIRRLERSRRVPRRTFVRLVAILGTAALALAACSGTSTLARSQLPEVAPSPAQIIDVTLSDTLRIDPGTMAVKLGEPVRFVVENTGTVDHEFFLGDAAAQDQHEAEMVSLGGAIPEEMDGMSVPAGSTKTIDHTFWSTASVYAGCHVRGHYQAGMRATIHVAT